MCPEVPEGTVGSCVEACRDDDSCMLPGQRCCSNGCGHSCVDAVPGKYLYHNNFK